MRSLSLRLLTSICLNALISLCTSTLSHANSDFEAFMRERERGVAQMEADFQTYKEKEDREFANFLKGRWKDYAATQGKPRMSAPEPTVAPQFRPAAPAKSAADAKPSIPAPVQAVPAVPVQPPVLSQVPAQPLAKQETKPKVTPDSSQQIMPDLKPAPPPLNAGAPLPEAPSTANALSLSFYGNELRIPFDAKWTSWTIQPGEKPAAMSAFWTLMSASAYEPTLKSMAQTRQALALDDWAYLNLWREYAQTLSPNRVPEQNLLLWFFLVKSGFDVRMAYSGDIIYLLVAVQQQVYESPQIELDGKIYYPLLADNFGVGMRSFYTYEASYPGRLRKVNLDAIRIGFAKVVRANRTLSFKFKDKTVSVSAPYNSAVIPYFNRVPPMDFSVYFNSEASDPLKRELLPELKRQTAKMSEAEAVEFLLALVQFSFEYKTTLQQFGRDKAFFVDDALYFPYSDCKARSVVFAWLVRNVLGLAVVGLHYPNHLTTAVELKGSHADWVSIEHRGKRYVYADPTYVGAPVGRQQREYRGTNPISVIDM